jgi:hypothetical protein
VRRSKAADGRPSRTSLPRLWIKARLHEQYDSVWCGQIPRQVPSRQLSSSRLPALDAITMSTLHSTLRNLRLQASEQALRCPSSRSVVKIQTQSEYETQKDQNRGKHVLSILISGD